jgi:uncharacterized protein (DUF2336 family)
MAVRKFLQWAPSASPAELVEGAGALARAFLYGDLPEPEREEARLTLTGLLDDSLPLVRRALAESFASAANVPHYMVLTLANDRSDVAAIVLGVRRCFPTRNSSSAPPPPMPSRNRRLLFGRGCRLRWPRRSPKSAPAKP